MTPAGADAGFAGALAVLMYFAGSLRNVSAHFLLQNR